METKRNTSVTKAKALLAEEGYKVIKDQDFVDAHDVGMVACIIAVNLWDEVYDKIPRGSMDSYELISTWAIEFHKLYEGKVNWGEDELKDFGFKNSGCWDEAVLEFAQNKLKAIE